MISGCTPINPTVLLNHLYQLFDLHVVFFRLYYTARNLSMPEYGVSASGIGRTTGLANTVGESPSPTRIISISRAMGGDKIL